MVIDGSLYSGLQTPPGEYSADFLPLLLYSNAASGCPAV
jgi:hypothetical protein